MFDYIEINPQPPWDPNGTPQYNVLEGAWFAKHRTHPVIIHYVVAPKFNCEPIFNQGSWQWRCEKNDNV